MAYVMLFVFDGSFPTIIVYGLLTYFFLFAKFFWGVWLVQTAFTCRVTFSKTLHKWMVMKSYPFCYLTMQIQYNTITIIYIYKHFINATIEKGRGGFLTIVHWLKVQDCDILGFGMDKEICSRWRRKSWSGSLTRRIV